MVRNAIQFIDDQGGPAVIARATGYGAGAVALWRHRNKLPRTAWPELLKAFPEVDLEELLAIELASAKPKQDQAA